MSKIVHGYFSTKLSNVSRWPLLTTCNQYEVREQFACEFTDASLTFMLKQERDAVVNELRKLELPNLNVTEEIQSIKKQWCNGKIDYFEYLMKLNKEAGRSFNDLMLYQVGPFVMADYTSQLINLENISMYRWVLVAVDFVTQCK